MSDELKWELTKELGAIISSLVRAPVAYLPVTAATGCLMRKLLTEFKSRIQDGS